MAAVGQKHVADTASVGWQCSGLRNRLIHGYDDVDLDIVWAIVTTDLPALVSQFTD